MKFIQTSDSDFYDIIEFLQENHQQRFIDILLNGEIESGITKTQLERQEQTIKRLQQKASELFSKGIKVTTQELQYECRLSRPAIDRYKALWLPYAIGSMVAPSPNVDSSDSSATVPKRELSSNVGGVVQELSIAPNVDSSATAQKMNNTQKSEDARQKISKAVADLQAEGKPITQTAISKKSGVTTITVKKHSDLFALGGEQIDFLKSV